MFTQQSTIPPSGPLKMIFAGPPEQGSPFFTAFSPSNNSALQILSLARDLRAAKEDLEQYKPDIIVISASMRDYSEDTIREIASIGYAIAIVGLVPPEGTWGHDMRRAGATVVYDLPVNPALLERLNREAPGIVEKARSGWRAPISAGLDADMVAAISASSGNFRTGVFTVWSIKGGVGKTSVSEELAICLAEIGGMKTLIVDANMNGGDIASRLRLNELAANRHIAHLAGDYKAQGNKMSAQLLKSYAHNVNHVTGAGSKKATGQLDVIFGLTDPFLSSSPALVGNQGTTFIKDLLAMARQHYDFVVVDSGSSITLGTHIGALVQADQILFIITPEIASIQNNRATIRSLCERPEYSINRDKFKMIINRYSKDSNVILKDIIEFLGMPVLAIVPEDPTRTLENLHNLGKSLVVELIDAKKSSEKVEPTMRGFLAVAESIFPPMSRIVKDRDNNLGGRKATGLSGLFGGKK